MQGKSDRDIFSLPILPPFSGICLNGERNCFPEKGLRVHIHKRPGEAKLLNEAEMQEDDSIVRRMEANGLFQV